MRRFFAALILSAFAVFGAHAQTKKAEPKASEYNLTGCSPDGLIAEHAVLSADGKTLDFNYYRDHDSVVKEKPGDDFVAQGQTSNPRPDGSRKFDGVGYLPDGQGGKSTLVIHGEIYKNKFAFVVLVHDQLKYAFYGYEGPVDDLVKLDQDDAQMVCFLATQIGAENVPELLHKWLHDSDAPPAKDETKS